MKVSVTRNKPEIFLIEVYCRKLSCRIFLALFGWQVEIRLKEENNE